MADADLVHGWRRGAVAEITLPSPQNRDALFEQLHEALRLVITNVGT